ncbi:hypothetical protein NVP1170O_121 [Vibrio phage 1.170.O._10N.261.52.C3]|nr:hypothetical protein NVP1170O_121 [Vibrio phage 1.170.O._10N.261.52.C3]
MKIKCSKCKKVLTSDLYQVPYKDRYSKKVMQKIEYEESIQTGTGEIETYIETDYQFKKGVFYISPVQPKENWSAKDMYGLESKRQVEKEYGSKSLHYFSVIPKKQKKLIVGKASILEGVIPKFKTGYGCCNWFMGRELLCECGHRVGEMYLDCYESGVVQFLDKNVDRSYK